MTCSNSGVLVPLGGGKGEGEWRGGREGTRVGRGDGKWRRRGERRENGEKGGRGGKGKGGGGGGEGVKKDYLVQGKIKYIIRNICVGIKVKIKK